MKKLLHGRLPTPDKIFQHKWLRPLRPFFEHPRLWHLGRRTVALGAAVGLFFGILVPFGQIPVAAAVASALRANLPAAVAGTFITNPITYAPTYLLAHQLGVRLLRWLDLDSGLPNEAAALWHKVLAASVPLAVGTVVLSIVAAGVGYVAVRGTWTWMVMRSWRRRGAAARAA